MNHEAHQQQKESQLVEKNDSCIICQTGGYAKKNNANHKKNTVFFYGNP